MNFYYTEKEKAYLSERDPALGAWIERLGHIERPIISDVFLALMNSIVSQQISSAAQKTVWERLMVRGIASPEAVLSCTQQELAELGLGPKKAGWVRSAALRESELRGLGELSDKEVIAHLIDFDGVGKWTAQMLMIFSLNRMDILSKGDFGIRKGLVLLHGEEALQEFDAWRALYAPYGSVASLYLWEIANMGGRNAQV